MHIEKYTLLQKLCKQHKVYPKQVFELKCGDGELLKYFAEKSKVYGIESSEKDYTKAKENIPEGKFYRQNINSFRIPFQGQLIYCTKSAFNKITKYTDREKAFTKIASHLEPYGLFIFQIHTDKYYKSFENQTHYTQKEESHHITEHNKSKNNIYHTKLKTFTHQKDNTYLLSESSSSETTFPLTQIKKSLQQHFENISITDIKWKKTNTHSNDIYIICQKGRE